MIPEAIRILYALLLRFARFVADGDIYKVDVDLKENFILLLPKLLCTLILWM